MYARIQFLTCGNLTVSEHLTPLCPYISVYKKWGKPTVRPKFCKAWLYLPQLQMLLTKNTALNVSHMMNKLDKQQKFEVRIQKTEIRKENLYCSVTNLVKFGG